MLRYMKLIAIIPSLLMMACNAQTPDKPVTKTDSGSNISSEKSENTEVVEVKEKKILKPGKLQVELPVNSFMSILPVWKNQSAPLAITPSGVKIARNLSEQTSCNRENG